MHAISSYRGNRPTHTQTMFVYVCVCVFVDLTHTHPTIYNFKMWYFGQSRRNNLAFSVAVWQLKLQPEPTHLCIPQRELMKKSREQKRNAPTLVLPNEDLSRPGSGRLSPSLRDDSKPLMRPSHNVPKVVSPYSQYSLNTSTLSLSVLMATFARGCKNIIIIIMIYVPFVVGQIISLSLSLSDAVMQTMQGHFTES